MSDTKTPEQRAREWRSNREVLVGYPYSLATVREAIEAEQDAAFLAGRADFIQHELPKLLEMARESHEEVCGAWEFDIADLIAMAEKGEV